MPTAEEIRQQIATLEAELRKQEAAEARAAEAGNAARAVALLAAMRRAFKEVESLYPGTFDPEKWAAAFSAQAWPRTTKFKRLADLSETQIHRAQEAADAAVASLLK